MVLTASWTGTSGNDTFNFNNPNLADLTAAGLGGNDSLEILIDSDGSVITGDAGDDTIDIAKPDSFDAATLSNFKNSTVSGGEGNDLMLLNPNSSNMGFNVVSDSLFNGNAGDDSMYIYARTFIDSSILGGQGNDTMLIVPSETISSTLVNGNDGNDSILMLVWDDLAPVIENSSFFGGKGDDYLNVTPYGGQISGSLISGDLGDDTVQVYANVFSSTVRGGEGNDTIRFGYIADYNVADLGTVVNGNEGNDSMQCNVTLVDGTIAGGADNDSIYVAFNEAVVNGNLGDDSIFVETNDGGTVYGGKGDDSIYVEGFDPAGAGTIAGGLGSDTLEGGNNDDVFQYTYGDTALTGITGADSIRSFVDGDDKIDLTNGNLTFNIAGLTGGITVDEDAVITGGVSGLNDFIQTAAKLTTANAVLGVDGVTIGLGGQGFIFVSNGNGVLDSDDILIRFDQTVTGIEFTSGNITGINV